jgi:hypothetical protein
MARVPFPRPLAPHLPDDLARIAAGHVDAALAVIREGLEPPLVELYGHHEERHLAAAMRVLVDLVYHPPPPEDTDAPQRPQR